ncbi:MAG TPA: serine hydrolase domain-containing protein [Gemmatimonadaceae bacterium]|jgi:CubicO group peptidase (beta-lactamase class C family)|nr:serine hydrolase domain-containing protein [Gemmatimonadaceae bacterium]
MRRVLVILAIFPALLTAQSASRPASGGDAAFSVERLRRVDGYLQQQVDSSRIAGAVGLVLRDGKVVYEHAVGYADKESGRRMSTDAMFRIASQTKALTSVAIMMLLEEGKVALGDPVSRFIPAYARTTVMVNGEVVPAKRRITIRDLLTHTAGISYGTDSAVAMLYQEKGLGPAAGWGWYTADKDEPVCSTMERLASLPFVRQPGEAWVYGYNSDVLGCVVEKASGITLAEFIRTRITGPLRMNDTYFFVPPAQRDRLVAVYASDSANRIARAPNGAKGQGHYIEGPRRSFSGGAGLVSTARDYARLLQMLLNGGELDGVRILSPQTVALMTTNQTGTLYSADGEGFGLGFAILQRLGADNSLFSVGSFGWGGAYGSQYRVDPKQGIVLVFMLNQLPNQSDVGAKFPTLVYQALMTLRN